MADPIEKVTNHFPDTQSTLAVIASVGFMGLAFYLALSGKTDSDAFKIMVGALISVALTQVYQFYFGSSKPSQTKDETISSMAAASPNGATAAAVKAAVPAAEVAVADALARRDETLPNQRS